MKVTLYIPFANGDAVNGFKYEGEELTAKNISRWKRMSIMVIDVVLTIWL